MAAVRRQAGAGECSEGPVDRTRVARSAVQAVRGEPGVLPVRADRAVAAGVGAVPVAAGEGAVAWSAAADPGLRADSRTADAQRAAIAAAVWAGQPAITLAAARGGQARTGLTARTAVRSRLVQLSAERPQRPKGRGASAGVRPGERTGRGQRRAFLGPLGLQAARKPPKQHGNCVSVGGRAPKMGPAPIPAGA